jgi:hypothetical protein
VSQDGITANDGNTISFKQKLAVISYLLSEYAGPPAFDFVPFGTLVAIISAEKSTQLKT